MPPPRGTWNPIEGPGDYTTTAQVHSTSYAAIDPSHADLTGKTILISGASRGIGRQIAVSFARAGASQIALAARSALTETAEAVRAAAKEAAKAEPEVLGLQMEVTDREAVERAAAEVGDKFGRVDVLVNCAGLFGGMGVVGETDPEEWWETMTVNVKGPYLTLRAFLPLLLKSELKTVVTISSVGAHLISPTLSAYQTSKLAVLRLTEFVAAEYADQGLIAYALHPGNVLTDMTGGVDEALKPVFTESPQLCGDALVFLAKERRAWLSGRYVNVTWDLPELVSEAKREEVVAKDLLKVKLAV